MVTQGADHRETGKIVPAPQVAIGHHAGRCGQEIKAQRVGQTRIIRRFRSKRRVDLARDLAAHLLGHALEMALNKHDRHHKLQRHHRQKQDQGGTPV